VQAKRPYSLAVISAKPSSSRGMIGMPGRRLRGASF
jgi:hypothetical protein